MTATAKAVCTAPCGWRLMRGLTADKINALLKFSHLCQEAVGDFIFTRLFTPLLRLSYALFVPVCYNETDAGVLLQLWVHGSGPIVRRLLLLLLVCRPSSTLFVGWKQCCCRDNSVAGVGHVARRWTGLRWLSAACCHGVDSCCDGWKQIRWVEGEITKLSEICLTIDQWGPCTLHHWIQSSNGSHCGLPPSSTHRKIGWVAISRIPWCMRTAPVVRSFLQLDNRSISAFVGWPNLYSCPGAKSWSNIIPHLFNGVYSGWGWVGVAMLCQIIYCNPGKFCKRLIFVLFVNFWNLWIP